MSDIQNIQEVNEEGVNIVGNPTPVTLPVDGINTIYQEKGQTLSETNFKITEFVDEISSPLRSGLIGSRILEKIQHGVRLAWYSNNSFNPNLANVNHGVGTLTDISREMDKNWEIQELRIMNSQDDTNKDFQMNNYEVGRYASNLLNPSDWQGDYFEEGRKSFKIKFASDVLCGGNFTTPQAKTYNAGTTGYTYSVPSFFSLINSAPSTATPVSSLTNTLLCTSSTGAKHYNSNKLLLTKQWSEFKALIDKLRNINLLTVGGIAGYLGEYKIVTSIDTMRDIENQDYLFYKSIKEMQDVGTLIVLPATCQDVYPKATSTTTATDMQRATPTPLPTLPLGRFVIVSTGGNALIQPVSNYDTFINEQIYATNNNITLQMIQRVGFDIRANSYLVLFDMNLDASLTQINTVDVTPA